MGVQFLNNDRDVAAGQVNNYNLYDQSYVMELFKQSFPNRRINSVLPFSFATDEDYNGTNINGDTRTLIGFFTFHIPAMVEVDFGIINDLGNFISLPFSTGADQPLEQIYSICDSFAGVSGFGTKVFFVGWLVNCTTFANYVPPITTFSVIFDIGGKNISPGQPMTSLFASSVEGVQLNYPIVSAPFTDRITMDLPQLNVANSDLWVFAPEVGLTAVNIISAVALGNTYTRYTLDLVNIQPSGVPSFSVLPPAGYVLNYFESVSTDVSVSMSCILTAGQLWTIQETGYASNVFATYPHNFQFTVLDNAVSHSFGTTGGSSYFMVAPIGAKIQNLVFGVTVLNDYAVMGNTIFTASGGINIDMRSTQLPVSLAVQYLTSQPVNSATSVFDIRTLGVPNTPQNVIIANYNSHGWNVRHD